MDRKDVDRSISVSLEHLTDIIKKAYESNPSGGIIRGFTLPGFAYDIVSKREAKDLCIIDKNGKGTIYRNAIDDTDANVDHWILTCFLITYSVRIALTKEFENYNFKKFDISTYPLREYRYRESKLLKYWSTGFYIPLMHLHIEW